MTDAPAQPRPSLLLLQTDARPPGGGAGVSAWMIEALKHNYDVTLLTLSEVRAEELNRSYGTALVPSDFRVLLVQPRLAALLDRLPLPLALLRQHLLFRRARRLARGFDVILNATNEAWLGRPVVQYVHFPWAYWPRPEVELRWFHRLPGVLRSYRASCGALSAFERERIAENLTLVNSDWTGAKFHECYGGATVTLPPPVVSAGAGRPWDARDDAFLCLGRIAPEKHLERAIAIVERLRATRPRLRLCLAGTASARHAAYARRIRALVAQRSAWLTLVERPDRAALQALMGRHRYGLHAMVDEHFGMAVAELARAGCIVFAHASGGQREILDDERLLYGSDAEAIRKIEEVLAQPVLQAELRARLLERSERLAPQVFMARLLELVCASVARPAGADLSS